MSEPTFQDHQNSPPQPTGGIMRLATTAVVLAYLGVRFGADQATKLAPAVVSAVDIVGRWFGGR